MVVPPHREGGRADPVHQAPLRDRKDGSLAPVLQWALERLHEPLTIAQLAREAHLSERTFARHFRESLGTTPLQWVLRERVRLAQELLETTDDPVENIARRTGFGTAANLRHHLGRLTTISPQPYRRIFRRRADAAQGIS
jgi:transcriptional regulator GlxA family with amidase domain